jgi:hypothetical protein
MTDMEGMKGKIWVIAIAGLAAISLAHAETPATTATAKKPAAGATPDANKGFRKKELNFEERVIEGLSNRGYESLSQTGSNDGLKGEKLYRKRAEFDEDSKSLLREMEYLK